MSRYYKDSPVKECYHGCPFFALESHLMKCQHPHFTEDKKAISFYENLIINHENSRNRVPDNCPLKNENVEIILRVHLEI